MVVILCGPDLGAPALKTAHTTSESIMLFQIRMYAPLNCDRLDGMFVQFVIPHPYSTTRGRCTRP